MSRNDVAGSVKSPWRMEEIDSRMIGTGWGFPYLIGILDVG